MADTGSGAGDAALLVLNLINGLIDMISGNKASILSVTLDQVNTVSDQVSTLGDNLVADTRALSDQIEASRSNVVQHIAGAVDDINVHADVNTSSILKAVNTGNTDVSNKLDTIEATLSHLGEDIGNAIAQNISSIVNAITQSEQDLISTVNEGLIRLDTDITNAIAMQGAQFAQAIDHAAASIDSLTQTQKDMTEVLRTEIEAVRDTLSQGLIKHADTLDKAIRESAFGISLAIGGESAAETASGAAISTAIASGCALIAEAIAASQAANKLLLAGKIAKDIELADAVLSIITAITTVITLESPEAVAAILTPVIDAYYNIGKTVTNQYKTNED